MTIRIGVLGAAAIVPHALLAPAHRNANVKVVGVAARQRGRALAFAKKHGIATTFGSYDEMLNSPRVDAIYIPLPTSLHAQWTVAALQAGKHVLCEKPLAVRAVDAAAIAHVAERLGLVAMEAHHSTHHPMTARLAELVRSGIIGDITTGRAWFNSVIPPGKNIRWDAALGGGALLDLGCYPIRMLQDVLPNDLTVTAARQWILRGVDRRTTATLQSGAATLQMECSMWSSARLGTGLTLQGSRGSISVRMPFHPHIFGRIRIERPSRRALILRPEHTSSYDYQLEAFVAAVSHGAPTPTDPRRAAHTLQILDDIHQAASPAGLPR